ncbi:MAG: transglycosylase domain-containing protein [Thermogemmatispora sp.]|uniref:transglycosylase domain-containing protein n=1 Tax=Thermogemmatispora sp. TaxID=1968838 RepID=UPI0019F5932C|nr:transglycosylase domain-containing protein [Thermogemmatispora sp.]MBE3567335.1 transglycosylase domain-containing protein [Thermogemmatispora sp.]
MDYHESQAAGGPERGGSLSPRVPGLHLPARHLSGASGQPPILAPLPTTDGGNGMPPLRRWRANRILLRKRWRRRFYPHRTPRWAVMLLAATLLGLALFSSSAGAVYAYYESQLPLLRNIANNNALFQTTRIYDRNGNLLYELFDHSADHGRRTYVSYTDISPLLINATVAAEDHTFWENSGVDLQGILRAVFSNLQSQSVVQGGSTITQQLIKNELFSNQPRTLAVKAEEAVLAYGLTQQYPKWKIMEMYLNTVYYGDLNYGAEAAAENYFNLQPKCTATRCKPAVAQLDLAQASLLAGLPQSPSYYDPTVNKPAALARQQVVLQSMVELGMITPQQAAAAEAESQKFVFKPYSETHHIQAPHFVQYVIDQLTSLLGSQNLLDGGYNVYTTLDLTLEKKVEQIVHDRLYTVQYDSYLGQYQGPLYKTNNVNNAAVVVMSPTTGEILAMDGSADFNNQSPKVQGQYNSALALRQPGSAFKPIVYAAAFEMGWYPAMIVPDHLTIYPTKDANSPSGYYTPNNYDQKFHTTFPMTIRNAIANSFNIPAVTTVEYVGFNNVLNMAKRLGITSIDTADLQACRKNYNAPKATPEQCFFPSIALGTAEVSLLELTGAYATFANQGVRVPPVSILEITDSLGHPLYRYDAAHPHGVRALGADVSFLISSILSDKASRYHEFGPGNPLELADRPAAAKTGTTQTFRDNWTVGYTPYLAVGVWAGNSDNSAMDNVIGITGAGPIWHDVMEYASQRYHYPAEDFIRPDDVHLGTVSALTGLLPRPGEPTVSDWFIDGTLPTTS